MLQRPPYISIALLSAGSLAYEILLMRLFSIIQWHHFAYMIIALALLGYGASGTIVSILQRRLLENYRMAYFGCVILFGLSAIICFQLAQHIPFNAEEILWDKRQILFLLANFLILMLPFFFAASGICLSFVQYQKKVSSIYAIDLVGAGIGSLSIIVVLFVMSPQWALISIGIMGVITAAIAAIELNNNYKIWTVSGLVLISGMLFLYGQSFELNISPYKSLLQTLRVEGANVVKERSSPLGYISVVQNHNVPLRHAPGLSLNSEVEPLNQLGVFTDADNMTVITQYPADLKQLAYLDQTTSALPYHLSEVNKVLIIGAGTGADVLQAKYHHVDSIDAVEMNQQIVDLVKHDYRDYSGDIYASENTSVHLAEARDYLARSQQHYNLIQLALVDAFNASSSGLYALNESYLYTTEALTEYYNKLEPDGYLAITRWLKLPPRDTLKLFATAVDALYKAGVNSPRNQLVLIRSWQTSTLLIKKGQFNNREIEKITDFCNRRLFDLAYTPSLSKAQTNRYNILAEPYLYIGATSLLSDKRDDYLTQYKFKLEPATDDRPYFNHYLKWSSIIEIFNLRDKGGMSLIEWGYIILIATMAVAVVSSVVLILVPLLIFRMTNTQSKSIKSSQVIYYFFAIGLAFLFIEIAFIQKFFQFLHHPIYAITTMLFAFLVFSGLGSQWSTKIFSNHNTQNKIVFITLMIALICLIYMFVLNYLFYYLANLAVFLKVLVSVCLIAPLAFFMGMPFPVALASIAKYESQLIPWAWGINGAASVVSAVLATLLAIHFGFTMVIMLAALLYVSVAFVFPEPINRMNL